MKVIRKYSIDELEVLIDLVDDKITKNQLKQIHSILTKKKKYITKYTKLELEQMGFVKKDIYMSNEQNHTLNIMSGEIDIIDNKIVRVGLGRVSKYNAEWYELELAKEIG